MVREKQIVSKRSLQRAQWSKQHGKKGRASAYSHTPEKVKKSPHDRLHTEVLWQSRGSPKSTEMLLRKRSFQRLSKLVIQSFGGSRLRVQFPAYLALQEATEAYLVQLCEDWKLCALHAKRVTVVSSDVHLVRCLRGGGRA
ncbi:histone H3.3 [Platysternon megacephalum]|uniref:Histone H3.3 n=1 Tax=Platysternon megacephalum TaxID=55544 RepID=A0A4D9DJU2_9SAUR|nr:histone H3.3 [Platysternon megacephalum]